MKIAHVTNYSPGLSGMYGTTRELILESRRQGIHAECIDDAGLLKEEYGKDGITPVPASWGDEADIICWHHAISDLWLNEPHRNICLFLHGTPRYNMYTELYEDSRTLSLIIGSANVGVVKEYISMWKRHVPIWESLLNRPVHYINPWVNVKEWRRSKRKVKKDTIRVAMLDYWRVSREPFGLIMALDYLRKNCDKKLEVIVWGLATELPDTWKAVIQWLVEDDVMVLKGRSANVQEEVYDDVDMIVTMSSEETRVVRESYAAGVPVVCGHADMHFTEYCADDINPDKLAEQIYKCHEDLYKQKGKLRNKLRKYAETEFDVTKAVKSITSIYQSIIDRYGSVNRPKYAGGYKMVATIDETAEKLKSRLQNNEPTAYVRNGDGELLFMAGKIDTGGMHKNSKKLQKDLIDAFVYKDKTGGYFVASAAGIINEKRMRPGMFGSFSCDDDLIKLVQKYRQGETLDNYIALAYKSVHEPDWFTDFLLDCVHGKKVLFIGGEILCQHPLIKAAFDVDTFIPLPMQDAYYAIKGDLWKQIKREALKHDLIICAAGMCANVICHRLWSQKIRTSFLDIGSIADAFAGIESRTWIKMLGDNYIRHYASVFLPSRTDIIVVTHNESAATIRCFESIAKYTSNYQVIWIDNGSEENEKEKMLQAAKQLENCNLVSIDQNIGFAGAANLGLKKSIYEGSAEWVVLLNNDTVVTENWLAHMIASAHLNNLDMIGPVSSSSTPHSITALKDVVGDMPDIPEDDPNQASMELFGAFRHQAVEVSGMLSFFACLMHRKRVIESVGLLDDNIFCYGEDNDYCERARRVGVKMGIALGVYVHHDHHLTANKMGEDWIAQQKNKSKHYLAKKWDKIGK